MEEDEDVVLEGSELHSHLLNNGFGDFEVKSPTSVKEDNLLAEIARMEGGASALSSAQSHDTDRTSLSDGRKFLTSTIWPDDSNRKLEVELAQEILRSELLVAEDEDFINNFILSEDVLEKYKAEMDGCSSYLGEVLLFSGSVAAVAGAVFFLSERTRAVAAAAAILPSAMAALSSVRLGAKVKSNSEAEHFKELLRHLLSTMKSFKQLLRKSLNLIQGMEMMNQGYLMTVNHTNPTGPHEIAEESQLSKALCKRSSFIELRRAIYSCTLQMILVYRESIQFLMNITPLADHIDLKDHYLAFIELENFGIETEMPDQRLSVRQLKDTIQLSLLQQSEYLRRFSLNFCEKVRENESLNKSGILKHVKDIVGKIRKVTEKLSKVFEYHQALGLLPVPELEQRALTLRKQQSLDVVKKLLPLRTVYTSLFSTGLHLQNSLLKVRHLESFFHMLENQKPNQDTVAGMLPDEDKLLEWLKGFREIQTELTACLSCLEDGVGQIDDITQPASSRSCEAPGDEAASDLSSTDSLPASCQRIICESDELSHVDEVFEAYIHCDTKDLKFEDDFVEGGGGGDVPRVEERKQSRRVLQELQSVLRVKRDEFQVREAKAMARQKRVDSLDVPSSLDIEGNMQSQSPQGSSQSSPDTHGFTQSSPDTPGFIQSSPDTPGFIQSSPDTPGFTQTSPESPESPGFSPTNPESTQDKKRLQPSLLNRHNSDSARNVERRSAPRRHQGGNSRKCNILPPGGNGRECNILPPGGFSQETDSDCDSIRSDAVTVKSQDSDPGHHSDSVSYLHSRLEDPTEFSRRSSDSDNQEEITSPRVPSSQFLDMSSSQQTHSESCRPVEPTRSFSTPDLKRFTGCEISSPYLSLEKLLGTGPEGDEDYSEAPVSYPPRADTGGTSSSSDSSSDSKQQDAKTNKRIFRRPYIRNASLRRQTRHKQMESTGRNIKGACWNGTEASSFSQLERTNSSVYMRKHREEPLQLNSQPLGFDSRLAAEAVAKSRIMRLGCSTLSSVGASEQHFGSSSDSDQK